MRYVGVCFNRPSIGVVKRRNKGNKYWSHKAPFSRLYLVKVVVHLKLATVNKPIVLLS